MSRGPAAMALVCLLSVAFALGLGAPGAAAGPGQQRDEDRPAFRFRTGVALINVSATVTDRRGRFVANLERGDFRVYDDGALQTISHFSRERVPVSLGIVLDTSGSMEGEKMRAARAALDRFLYDLLGPDDEVFLYRFSYRPRLVHGWTRDRDRLSRALGGIRPTGGTALYDAVAEAVSLAEEGRHRKKAVVIISDGNDTNSETDPEWLRRRLRETDVLVYAIGIDGDAPSRFGRGRRMPAPRQPPVRLPFPVPGGGGRAPLPTPIPFPGARMALGDDGRVNVSALRDLTDDSGGRTEIIRDPRDLEPATAGVADELSRQYFLGYVAPGHGDGRWHTIEVEVSDPRLRVRARRGYVASP
ncbi:MAG: VWA domain-containing protein [Acidobacteria bacterium]|nr:VWA domain-containing protein [Acidobacteriota bacterium]